MAPKMTILWIIFGTDKLRSYERNHMRDWTEQLQGSSRASRLASMS